MRVKKETELHRLQAEYERYVLLTTSLGTARRYSKALEAFFGKFKDRKSPDEFTRADMQDFALYRRRDGCCGRTINYELGIVKTFWNWMMQREVVNYNPASSVKRQKEKEAERKALTIDEQLKLYETAAATGVHLDAVLVGLALATGLRAETLYQLDRKDIDFETSTLRIPAIKMKAGRNHDVPLRPDLLALLRDVPDGRIFEGYAKNAPALTYHFNKILKRAGLSAYRGIRLGRRTFATTLLRTGADLKMVQDLLGHKNISTTSRYLIPADQSQIRDAVNKLPQAKPLPETLDDRTDSSPSNLS